MIKINFSGADIAVLQYWRFHHPDPRVQVRMEALYLRSQGVANRDIPPLCGISKASFHRFRDKDGNLIDVGAIPRAIGQGRTADVRLHAESYTDGARNFDAVQQVYGGDPDVKFIFDLTSLDPTTGKPRVRRRLPKKTLRLKTDDVARDNLRLMEQFQQEAVGAVPSSVIEGARTIGDQIWPSVPGGFGGH